MKKRCLSATQLKRCGQQEGLTADEDGSLILPEEGVQGIFVSKTYDSGKAQTQWNRLALWITRSAVFSAYVWLFDQKEEGEKADAAGSVEQCFAYVKERAQYSSIYWDLLLYGGINGRGRYAKLALKIMREDEKRNTVFRGYDLSFPKESFAAYLPVIYQNHLPLDRFLAVYQNIYLELEEKIDALAEELDFECCGKEQVVRLAQWMGWEEPARLAAEDKGIRWKVLQKLLRAGIHLADRKGTCGYYTELAQILLGCRAVSVEDPGRRRLTILVESCREVWQEPYLEWMKKAAPIGICMDFIFLHRTDRLDRQYFLDKTAIVSPYEAELRAEGICVDNIRLQ
ncbi:MAG: hypothetical protein NC399_07380 [Muribaculum sp.]|nr:hypothetical protein [Muribaculum sp.]